MLKYLINELFLKFFNKLLIVKENLKTQKNICYFNI
jgi:hypothetical protein